MLIDADGNIRTQACSRTHFHPRAPTLAHRRSRTYALAASCSRSRTHTCLKNHSEHLKYPGIRIPIFI